MIHCPKCDHFNLADATECERCGQPLAEDPAPTPAISTNPLDGQVLAIAGSAGKIAAIKHYREKTGAGLKEAKEAVEQLMARHNVTPPKAGCAGLLLWLALSGLACGALAACG
jgi:ribosomal protein L7/L12